jgi:molybdopterin synthase catalytic subunit
VDTGSREEKASNIEVSLSAPVTIRIQEADFDIAREIAALTAGRKDIGAVVTFSGICRDSEGSDKIAIARWPLTGLTVIHRVGRITPGENIVLVLTASAHRQAAFEAAEFLMDYLKTNAPFWKSEESAKGKSWIEARDHDDAAAARWTKS